MKVIYTFLVRLWSLLFIFRKKSQVTYLMSFGNNQEFVQQLVAQIAPLNLHVFYQKEVGKHTKQLEKISNVQLELLDNGPQLFLKVIPILMHSKLIIIDNYFPFLGALVKTNHMRISQIWHANGAIKQFGFNDPTTSQRSNSDHIRFQQVYESMDDIVVGSEKMGDTFQVNYRLDGHQIRRLGYPRSDKFLNSEWIKKAQANFFKRYPDLKNKHLILYAPTYRQGTKFDFAPGFENLQLPENSVLILRLHPHLQAMEKAWEDRIPFITSIDASVSTDELLTVVETLITDYSSILFDYTLLKNAKKVGLFAFDQFQFKQTVGLHPDFATEFQPIIIKTVDQLSAFLADPKNDQPIIDRINHDWNQFNDGNATNRTINFLLKRSDL